MAGFVGRGVIKRNDLTKRGENSLISLKNLKIWQIYNIQKNATICLTYAIVLKFGQDHHHNDKRNVSIKIRLQGVIFRNFATCQNVKFSILSKKGKIN